MSEISVTLICIPIAAYLLGSIPFGLLFTKLFVGGDVCKAGSGNIGATNVARVAGPLAGILTLLFDAAKGAAAAWLAARFSNESATCRAKSQKCRSAKNGARSEPHRHSRRRKLGHRAGHRACTRAPQARNLTLGPRPRAR